MSRPAGVVAARREPPGASQRAAIPSARAGRVRAHQLARIARGRADRYRRLAARFAPPPGGTPRDRRAYTRLFVAPRPRLYPYESMYRDEPPRVMGEHTREVARWYRDAGFAVPAEWHDLPDHIALELGFMAALAETEAAEWERGEARAARALAERERGFVEAHLLPWVPAFSSAVLQAAPGANLREAARSLQAWIPRDHDWLLRLTAAA